MQGQKLLEVIFQKELCKQRLNHLLQLSVLAAGLGKYLGVLALTVKLCMLAPIGFFKRNCDLDLGRCHRTPAIPPALSVPGQEQPIRHNL